MRLERINVRFLCIIGMLLFSAGAFADYIEGVDTTDANGNGLNSAFNVNYGSINVQNGICYRFQFSAGYFNYAFDDIKMSPDSNYSNGYCPGGYSLVFKNSVNNTFSKVKIISQLADKRYAFKFGTNTMPNNRMLEKANYDRSVRYKPNNFKIGYNSSQYNSSWDPPLPNNNHLIGYISYNAKNSENIDTTAPINLGQWDSIAFTTSTNYSIYRIYGGYFNLVAVYTEGKSEFLKGWTKVYGDNEKQKSQKLEIFQGTLVVKKASGGCSFSLPSSQSKPFQSLSIYNSLGKKISEISNIKSNDVFWKTSGRNFPYGLYIARLEFSDKTSCNRTLILSSQ